MPMTRISDADHRTLQDIAAKTGMSHNEIIHEALDIYQRDRLLDAGNEAYARLKSNKKEWASMLRERRLLEGTNLDGLKD
jgi:hypothetical protein